jgi:hypothetical protein
VRDRTQSRLLAYAAVAAFHLLSGGGASASPLFSDCAPIGAMLKRMMAEESMGYLANGTDESFATVHMWFVSRKTRRWAELAVDDSTWNACIVRRGSDWRFAMSN